MAGQTLSASGQLPEAPLRNLPQGFLIRVDEHLASAAVHREEGPV